MRVRTSMMLSLGPPNRTTRHPCQATSQDTRCAGVMQSKVEADEPTLDPLSLCTRRERAGVRVLRFCLLVLVLAIGLSNSITSTMTRTRTTERKEKPMSKQSSPDIRIGLAGLGSRGLYWLQLLQSISGFRVVALCDSMPATHEAGLAKLGDNRA